MVGPLSHRAKPHVETRGKGVVEPSSGSIGKSTVCCQRPKSGYCELSPFEARHAMRTRLVLIVPNFPKLSETFIASKFLGMLERGWDVYVVCASSEFAQWKNFPDLERHPEARQRTKVTWPHRPQWLAALLLPFAVLWCF